MEPSEVETPVDEQAYPLSRVELASLAEAEIDPELDADEQLSERVENFERSRFESSEQAYEHVSEHLVVAVRSPDWATDE